MRSGGFVGKRQARNEPTRHTSPPKGEDLTQLLGTSQKSPEKLLTWSWQSEGNRSVYTLSVITTGAGRSKGGGWSASAVDNSALADSDWKLMQELDGQRTEVFVMRTSDAHLILTLVDEALIGDAQVGELRDAIGSAGGPDSDEGVAASRRAIPPPVPGTAPVQEGNLRQTDVRSLIESYCRGQITGRLICDSGNVQAEVFFSQGEPVHAKSCHTIYQDKDCIGDSVIVELLTWRDGNYKFQEGWPAASKTVTRPMQDFLDGRVTATPQPSSSSQPAPPPQTAGTSRGAAPAPAPVATGLEFAEDFSNVDDVVASMYELLVEPDVNIVKYGMFLMLAQSEFVRFTTSNIPFCIASIGLGLLEGRITIDDLRQIGECFHPVCQPLDLLAYASQTRLFALFPQCPGPAAASTMKHFINNVLSTQFESGLDGSKLKIAVGLCEIPKDGTEFEHVIAHTVKLRREASDSRKVVTTFS
jgi:hypothetical protein